MKLESFSGIWALGAAAAALVSGIGNLVAADDEAEAKQSTTAATAFVPQMAYIPGGSFEMGDHFNFVDPDHPSDEVPLHTVSIGPFFMSTTLLTCSEYCEYLNAALSQGLIELRSGSVYAVGGTQVYIDTASAVPLATISWSNNQFVVRSGRELHPITGVRWFGAIAYCNWRSARDGLESCYNMATGACDLTKNGYRLPTEAEWEYAARGGQINPYRQFPWGDDTNADGRLANWEHSGDPWESGDYPHTTPVGFYNGSLRVKADYNWPAAVTTYQTRDGSNGYGLYDMAGNAWEWVNDWYQSSYYSYCLANAITSDPPGPTTGDVFADHGGIAYRALRGGTWWNGGGQQFYGFSRVSNRNPSWSLGPSPDGNPNSSWLQVGFRIMRPDRTTRTVGLFVNTDRASPGYTLLSPIHSTETYLLNNSGQYVHRWTSTGEPGRSSYLLENGHLIRASSVKSGGPSTGGGEGGRIEEYDWDGNLVWAYDFVSSNYIAHHDFKVLPNGNVLILASEKKLHAEVIAAGFNPSQLDPSIASEGYMLPDFLIEVKPTKPYGGTIVWEWHIWDHLIQDFDATKANYGVVANHPELIDANGISGGRIQQFWNHVNGIDYNPQLDQVMISVRGNSELFVVDHGTTTAQAASHSGGRYDKGGDLLYRWGYPQQYDRGTSTTRMLYQQHHTHWIEAGLAGAGNILIFNNGIGRGYSTVDEIVPPVDAAGNYAITAGAAFGPSQPVWTYKGSPAADFYSAEISGSQRLPNGNTLICEGIKGNLFEVTSAGQIVWRYVCPVTTAPLAQGSAIPADSGRPDQYMNAVFRVVRYAPSYAGLQGRSLTAIGTIETYTTIAPTAVITTQPKSQSVTAGASASFTVAVSGTGLSFTYRWQRLANGSSNWSDLTDNAIYSGTGTATLTVGNATTAMSGDQVRCVVSYTTGTGLSSSLVTAAAGSGFSILGYSSTPASLEIATLAGQAGSKGGEDGLGRAARFSSPSGVAVDGLGNLFVADWDNHTIRMVTATGVVSTLAGEAGSTGSNDGADRIARFCYPSDVAVDDQGTVFVADTLNHCIRAIAASGEVSTLAGLAGARGSVDGVGADARFAGPEGLDVDHAGHLYVADTGNHTIRIITLATGSVRTIAGLAGLTGSADGNGSSARFNAPSGLALDAAGNLLVADEDNHVIRKVDSHGWVSTLAGRAGTSGSADGSGSTATFNHPSAVVVNSDGNVFVADTENHTIRRIDGLSGVVSTFAGAAGVSDRTDGDALHARFLYPAGIAVDEVGDVFIADSGNHTLRIGMPGLSTLPYTPSERSALTAGSVTSTAATLTVTAASNGAVTATTSSGGGGGGGGPSYWCLSLLLLLTSARGRSDLR